MVVRDRNGDSVVIEFIDGKTVLTEDKNDDHSGFGIMTNEPTIDWHIENVKHAKWKLNNARPAFSIPGNFYPDERFLRIYLLKTAMDKPTSYREAIMQAVHVLNSVTVPMGNQLGTDSSAGEGAGDHQKGEEQLGVHGGLLTLGLQEKPRKYCAGSVPSFRGEMPLAGKIIAWLTI